MTPDRLNQHCDALGLVAGRGRGAQLARLVDQLAAAGGPVARKTPASTVTRWLNGSRPIPRLIAALFGALELISERERRRLVRQTKRQAQKKPAPATRSSGTG